MGNIRLPADPPVSTLTCRCGRATYKATSILTKEGDVSACWLAIGDRGEAIPGCCPDERYDELCARRLLPRSTNRTTKYPGAAMVRCSCGRTTRVITSNVNSIDAAPDPEPLDECAPVMATSCWLAIVDSSLIAGCAPDERTQDILARRGLITRPTRAFVDIAIDESSPRVPGRPLPPASFRRLLAPTPASVPATTRSDGQIYDDLTSENTAVEPKHSAAPVQLVRASAPKKSAAKNAPTKALPNEMLSLFG